MAAAASFNTANAASVSQQLGVSLEVNAECSIENMGAIDFGSRGILGAEVEQAISFGLKCTEQTPFTISIDGGTAAGPDGVRYLTGASTGNKVAYELYTDAARTKTWGGAGNGFAATGTGANQNITVYARLPSQPAASPDTYTDNVTLSVNY